MSTVPERIIVIDDEERMCTSLQALLQGNGYEVVTFQRSPEAVDSIRQGRVDLVITDIKMPQMSGLEILREVKNIDEGIPVILMTGYASIDSAQEAIAQGAYDYLMKPVEFQYLEHAVKRALERRRSELARNRLMEELRLSNIILKRRVGELNALYEAGKSIGSSANLSELLRQIVVLAASVTEAQIGSIMLLDDKREYLTIEAAIGLSEDIVNRTRLPIGASIAGYVAKTGEPLVVKDVENDPRFQRINNERYGPASLLCTPLKIKNNILGVINMAHKEGNQTFDENDLRLLTTFASQAAVAVDDAYQFESSRRRLAEFEILHELQRELHDISSLSQFRRVLVEKLTRIFPIDYAIWFDVDTGSGTIWPDSVAGQTDIPMTESGRIDLRELKRSQLSLDGFDLDSFDPSDTTVLSGFLLEQFRRSDIYPHPSEAFMAVPIIRSGELAHLFVLGAESEHPYSDDDISLAQLVINQAALLFERERALLNSTRLLTMGNMISEISHDLRRPLTSIKGALQVFRERNPDVAGGSDLFGTAEQEVGHMNDMVRELVDFANPNRYETSKEDLRNIVLRASELLGPDIRKRNVDFEYTFQDADWEVIVNKNQVLEVFLNIMINAMDAMSEGGRLTVTGLIEKPEHKKQNYRAIRITDTGSGIAREDLSRIFERYYTTKETGTGLGLVVVERVVSAHGGTIRVESTEGEGTTVTVYFPITA
jgi:signal transduction histidine kinase/FixJ family two-component response regulator